MVKTINEKTPCGGAYSKVFYCDSSGEPTSPEKSCQMIIHEYSEGGALLRETIAFTNGWFPNIDEKKRLSLYRNRRIRRIFTDKA